jgi:hypothetical protein
MRRERLILTLTTVVAVLVTFAVYRPDRNVPFDFLDFSEFLPLLQEGDSYLDRLSKLVAYYATQGRFNLLGYAGIAAKWGLWGDSSPGWQWTRFFTMWVAILLTYRVLRRVGVNRVGAVMGCSMFLFAPVTFDGWMRLTTAEPLGVLLLLAGCLLALSSVSNRRTELLTGLAFAAICAGIILVKEMLVFSLVLPLLLPLVRRGIERTALRTRLRTLIVSAIASVPLAATPVVLTAMRAPRQAYTTAFGSQTRPPSDVLAQWSLAFVPFDPGNSFPARFTGIALIAFSAIVIIGWTLRVRAGDDHLQLKALLPISLLFPLLGTLIYLPWPAWSRFYLLPFLLSGAILTAIAFEGIDTRSRRAFYGAAFVWFVLLMAAGTDAYGQSNRLIARQLTNRAVVTRLASLHASFDTVFVATDQKVPAAWQGLGPTLERYGRAFELSMPVIINVPCQESRARAESTGAPITAYSSHCPGFAAKDPIVFRYRRLRLGPLPLTTTDSIRVDFILP